MNNRGLSRLLVLSIATAVVLPPSGNEASPPLPSKAQIIAKMKLANDRFMAKWPDPCSNCLTGNRPSNIWTRAVYYEGALAYARLAGDSAVWNHAVKWGTFHKWNFRNGTTTTNADDQCAGQCYIELYQFDRKPERITNTRSCMDNMVKNKSNTFWTWIDAIQMAMPVFAKLGVIDESAAYFDKMDALFDFTASTLGLYNTNDRLWWRDTTFKKAKTPAGKNIYWSRGNGWVFAALARVLDVIPATDPRCEKYTAFFIDMAAALKAVQRSDGFWNESLADPAHFGGPEVTGTGLFTYGMAWGANRGILDKAEYLPTILRAWNAIADSAIFPDGAIGYVQGTGDSPGDNGSGVTGVTPSRDIIPDFDDYGLGCVLLAGSETAILAGDPTGAVAARSFERTFSKPVVAVQTISGLQRRGLSLSTATWYDLSGRSAGRSTIAHFFPMNVSTASGFFFMYPEDR